MALIRVAKGAAATLTHTFTVGESVTDSTTAVTVSGVDATGVTVFSGTASSAGAGTGRYTFTMAGQAALSAITVSWSGTIAGAAVTETDQVEIVGGFFFTLLEGRASDPVLADATRYPTDELAAVRTEVETECEWICLRAFVPRYRRVVLDGTGTTDLVLPDALVRTVRSASVAPRYGQAPTALTVAQLAAVAVVDDQSAIRTDGAVWTEGRRNVVVEYEYGGDAPPADLVRAAKIRFRSRLNIARTGIPDRATSFTSGDGGTYRLSMPDAFLTGIPEVDAAYGRYSRRVQATRSASAGLAPASRMLEYDPQRWSLFHGGQR